MKNGIEYLNIVPTDYGVLTRIMTAAFNEDTAIHTNIKEDGPNGYNNGSLIKKLNEQKDFESFKIIYNNIIVGAYTISFKPNKEYTLEMLFIDPKYREYHIGTTVWKNIEEKYVEAKVWIVETPDYSKRNHYFYTKKCGFTFLKENQYSNGAVSFIFKKEKCDSASTICSKEDNFNVVADEKHEEDNKTDDILSYYKNELKWNPPFAEIFSKYSKDALKGYLVMRESVQNAHLPKKTSELIFTILDSLDDEVSGAKAHAVAAIEAGLTMEELVEAFVIVTIVRGINVMCKAGSEAIKAAEEKAEEIKYKF
ncbi:GNAT family N-acetyltransferase [Clostridium sp.]|uniref:GNAT family N-acetyltransferase n=1 Tax=Clostridium sp. TaxID=1506 RepID=UPI00284F66C4|nr:GNAT family N-acetyltransferase [Clostridium sp.]MDR3598349.1 GNAT family N-acetyltransferase [Clostridium sp.]